MRYSIELLKERYDREERIKFLFFTNSASLPGEQLGPTCLGRVWPSPFKVNDVVYKTVEHFILAEKARQFRDEETRSRIIQSASADEAMKLGGSITSFNHEEWTSHRSPVALKAILAKFSQHTDLREFLLGTGEKYLAEATPGEQVWSIGVAAENSRAENPHYWKGLNLAGFLLMEARDILRDKKSA